MAKRTVYLIEGGQFNAHTQKFNITPKNVAFSRKWRAKRHVENVIEVNEGYDVEPFDYEIGDAKCNQFDYKWLTKEGKEVKERLIIRSIELH